MGMKIFSEKGRSPNIAFAIFPSSLLEGCCEVDLLTVFHAIEMESQIPMCLPADFFRRGIRSGKDGAFGPWKSDFPNVSQEYDNPAIFCFIIYFLFLLNLVNCLLNKFGLK